MKWIRRHVNDGRIARLTYHAMTIHSIDLDGGQGISGSEFC